MTRSRRTTPIAGITVATTEKADKQFAHRRERRAVRSRLAADPTTYELCLDRHTFGTPWEWAKDGKSWFDPARFPILMRK